jgi:predicted transcriptional regulator
MSEKIKRRGRWELMRDILEAVSKSKGEILKTTAMHAASTNFRVFQPYVKMLTDAEFISARKENTGNTFRIWLSITEKGKEFIEQLDKVMAGIEEEERQ